MILGGWEVKRDWEKEGEVRGCEIVCVGVCACMNAGKREGYSEICNALLNKVCVLL